MRMRNDSISQKGIFRHAVNYMYINVIKFNKIQSLKFQHLIFLCIEIRVTAYYIYTS